MGNCIMPASSMEWGGDDWGSLRSSDDENTRSSSITSSKVLSLAKNVKKEKLLQELKNSNGKVKIKISKKEVAELLGVIEKQNQNKKEAGSRASAEQVLIRLINTANQHHDGLHRPWKPMLETVHELD